MNEDLPGMLALAEGVATQKWPHTVDAKVWATEWMRRIQKNPAIATDKDCMLGWFANAIMAGYDTAQARGTKP